MFWGLTLMPGEPCTKILDKSVCLSMAALESRQAIGSGFTQVVIQADGADHLLCTLMSGVIFQQYMNVKLLKGEKITLSVEGSGVVHLTGFTIRSEDERGERDQNNFEEGYYGELQGQAQDGHEYSFKVEDSLDDGEGWVVSPEVGNSSSSNAQLCSEPSSDGVWLDSSENTGIVEPTQANIPYDQTSDHLDLQEENYQDVRVGETFAKEREGHSSQHQMPEKGEDLQPILANVTAQSRTDWQRVTGSSENTRFIVPRIPLRTKRRAQSNLVDNDIEARRLRWRIAKREQRKKNRLKALMSEELGYKSSGQSLSKDRTKNLNISRRYRSPSNVRQSIVDYDQGRYKKSLDGRHVQGSPSTSSGPQLGQRMQKENR